VSTSFEDLIYGRNELLNKGFKTTLTTNSYSSGAYMGGV